MSAVGMAVGDAVKDEVTVWLALTLGVPVGVVRGVRLGVVDGLGVALAHVNGGARLRFDSGTTAGLAVSYWHMPTRPFAVLPQHCNSEPSTAHV